MAITKPISIYHDYAYPGMIADGQLFNTISGLNNTTAVIPAGTAVQWDGDTVKPVATGGTPIGVVLLEQNNVQLDGAGVGINPNCTGSIVTDGVIYVKAKEVVAKGDDVFAGVGANVKDGFTKTAGSDVTEAIQVPNAKWLDATQKDKIGRIKITIGG